MSTEISSKVKDIIQKHASGLFKDATLEFYGVKTAKIKELINVELPDVNVKGSSMDLVFLLEDDSYLHLEFQSSYSKNDIIRFAGYDLRLYERDGRVIRTVIVYSSDVEDAPGELEIGSLVYKPEKIMMAEHDGNTVFEELDAKIKIGDALTDVDMLSLIFLPLMRHTLPRYKLAADSIRLADTIPDKAKRDACVAAAVAFASKYLDENKMSELLEVLRVSVLYERLGEYAEALIKNREEAAEARAKAEKTIEIAKRLLRNGLPIANVAEGTGLDEDTVRGLKEN